MIVFYRRSGLMSAALLTLVLTASVSAAEVDFVHDVMPILKQHCGKCHTGEKREGGLAMNTRAQLLSGGENGKAVISGNAAKSSFIERIESDNEDIQMPPEGPRVPPEKIAILKENGVTIVTPSSELMSSLQMIGVIMSAGWSENAGAEGKALLNAYRN